ncbi:site-specific DNA-methyltransferase [Leuconostoc citreum]
MEELLHYKTLPLDIPYGSFISIDTVNVTPITHGFHKYPGKFIPQIPRWALAKYLGDKKNASVLDPFVGSGTTLVETTISGRSAFGIDIDPLSVKISKVKSTPVNTSDLKMVFDWVLTNKDIIMPKFKPQTENLQNWFSPDAINKLSRLRTTIDAVKNEFSFLDNINDLYDVLIISFSSIIRRVSKADNQSQKTYVSHTKIKEPAEVYSLFEKQLKLYIKGFTEMNGLMKNKSVKPKVVLSEGSPNFHTVFNKQFDLIITSPPYIKSVDYVYNQMVELFWIGDLFSMDTQPKQNEKRKKYVGSTLVSKKQYKCFADEHPIFNIPKLDRDIKTIMSSDNKNGLKHAYIVAQYFEFMTEHFRSAYESLVNNGIYVMAVGNSTVSGIEIDTASFLTIIAEKQGLSLINRWSYKIQNHFMGFNRLDKGGKITMDHMLIFQKKNRP